ncbi:MAG: hypothetical protein AAFR61_12455 [Bacteroidota bacterium]
MNWRNGFFIVTALWLATLVWAFFPAEKNQADQKAAPITRGADTPPCDIPPLEIECAQASADIAAYDGFITNAEISCPSGDCGINPSLVKGLDSKGFKIPKCELNEMLDEYTAAEEIWAMLALKEYAAPGEPYTHVVSLIFQGVVQAGVGEECDIDGTTWKYFDFTLPCPTLCPGGGDEASAPF